MKQNLSANKQKGYFVIHLNAEYKEIINDILLLRPGLRSNKRVVEDALDELHKNLIEIEHKRKRLLL